MDVDTYYRVTGLFWPPMRAPELDLSHPSKIHHLSLQRINHKSLLGTSIMAAHHLPSIMPIGCRDLIMGFKISSVIGELKYEPGLQSLVVKLKRERERESEDQEIKFKHQILRSF
jgi:hypothetical protein